MKKRQDQARKQRKKLGFYQHKQSHNIAIAGYYQGGFWNQNLPPHGAIGHNQDLMSREQSRGGSFSNQNLPPHGAIGHYQDLNSREQSRGGGFSNQNLPPHGAIGHNQDPMSREQS